MVMALTWHGHSVMLLLLVHALEGFLGAEASAKNPFLDQAFYINPVNSREFDASISTASGKVAQNLKKMQTVPSAYWIDTKDKIRGSDTRTVEGILKDASSKSPPELVVLMWYDLPNRDCDAKASNGEICCSEKSDGTCDYLATGDCSSGLHTYKSEYVDPFVDVLSEYDGKLQVVLVMEPDGLANLATNIAYPQCGNIATQTAYKEGVRYAVEQLASKAPSVSIYLDAAHGGWLGWENNLGKFMKMLKGLELPFDKIRGFATNVANYQALGVQCPWCPDQGFRNGFCLNNKHSSDPCCEDPCGLLSQWNFGNNELNYAAGLVAAARAVLEMEAHVIIDTGRNGVTNQRQDCANWCNPRGAGTGIPSTTDTANKSLVDAYFWLKTPGESDGCSEILPDGKKCPRFDAKCGSVDSIGSKDSEPRAVEAGTWFDFQVKQLAENAVFEPPSHKSEAKCPAPAGGLQPPPLVPSGPTGSGSANSSESGECAGAYQQCGGQGWLGATCCQEGCLCTGSGGFYSQCTPSDPTTGRCGNGKQATSASHRTSAGPSTTGNVATTSSSGGSGVTTTSTPASTTPAPAGWNIFGWLQPSPTPAPTVAPLLTLPPTLPPMQVATLPPLAPLTTAPPTSATPSTTHTSAPQPSQTSQTPSAECALPYGQCGGANWQGPTCCDVYCNCEVLNPSYSQCKPTGDKKKTPGSDLAVILKDEQQGPADSLVNAAQRPSWSLPTVFTWVSIPLACAAAALAVRSFRLAEGWRLSSYILISPHRLTGTSRTAAAASNEVEGLALEA